MQVVAPGSEIDGALVQISSTMTQFEQQFEDMDVRAGYMEGAMNSTTSSATPQEEVFA